MKMMKWALLGGAALAVTATAARADDLTALKAQIEALQTRVSQLEAQPQAAQPSASGYSLLAIRDGQGTFEGETLSRVSDRVRPDQGFTLSVMPTADVAPVAEVSVSGEIRTLLLYTDEDHNDDNLDVANRGRVFVKGKIDTAVGEVGGYFRFQASGGGNFSDYDQTAKMTYAYGWWKFAPEWELLAGMNDNTGALTTTWDWNATDPVKTVGPSNTGNEQFRLTYTSGPLSFGVSLEDPDNINFAGKQVGTGVFAATGGCTGGDKGADGDCTDLGENATFAEVTKTVGAFSGDTSDLPNAQAFLAYTSDSFSAQIAGLVQDDNFGSTDWAIGGGVNIGVVDRITLLAAALVGEGTSSYANNISPATPDDDFWGGSVGIIAKLSDDMRFELGAGIEDYDKAGEADGINGGLYWDPVSQVTLGAGATYVDFDSTAEDTGLGDTLQVFFGTWLRFP